HQLRGRVGRGDLPGLCMLVTDAEGQTPARERLDAVAATTDGFELSRIDREMRKEGDGLGQAQPGAPSSRRMRTRRRADGLTATARQEAHAYAEVDPEMVEYPPRAEALDTFLPEERAEYLDKG